MKLQEAKTICQQLIHDSHIDFLDISLWDVFKQPEELEFQDKSLLQYFAELDYKHVKWTVAGKINSGQDVRTVLDAGVDFVSIGRSAILHHDFPKQVLAHTNFEPTALPVSEGYLRNEGLGEKFVTYMKRWDGFVTD